MFRIEQWNQLGATHFAWSKGIPMASFARSWNWTRLAAWVSLSVCWRGAEYWGVVRGVGQETVNHGTDGPTGMHRPWGDFCVYRSALTRELRASMACNAPKERGLLRFFVFPFSPFLTRRARPFFPSCSLFGQSRFGPTEPRLQETVISQPLRKLLLNLQS